MPALTPHAFVHKWRQAALQERCACQAHFAAFTLQASRKASPLGLPPSSVLRHPSSVRPAFGASTHGIGVTS
jgi:hypothetical protein